MGLGHLLLTGFAVFSLLCTVAVLFFERKNPASSLAWILVLLSLPVIGFVLYLFLGSGFRVNKRKKFALKAIADNLYDNYILRNLNLEESQAFLECHGNNARLLTYLRNEGEGVLTDNNSAEVFTDGNGMFPRLLEDLRRAERHIHMLFYIFRNDALGREILSILTEKARRGVEVRLIYDSVGTMMASDAMFRDLMRAGGEVAAFLPIFSTLNSHLRLNYRNHRKIVVVDGAVGYVGGMNVGEEYLGRDEKLTPWRDTHLRLTGSAVWFLQERFIMDWGYAKDIDPHNVAVAAYFPLPEKTGNLGIQIISSGPDTFESPIKSGLLSMIYSARKSIYIQSPYFAPDASFFDALRIAAHSNIDVRLMIPMIGDYRIVHSTTMGYARDAWEYGVKIYLYRGFLHAKTIVVDGEVASIGTTNLTNRSFTLDFEVNAFIYDRDFASGYEEIFRRDLDHCVRVDGAYFSNQGLLVRARNNFSRLFAPMM